MTEPPTRPTTPDVRLFPPVEPKSSGLGAGIRTWFLTGIVIAGPLAVTGWLVWWFVNTVDQWVRPLIPTWLWPDTYLPVRVPGTGVLLAFLGLTLLGFLTANLAGRSLIRLGEMILDQMPLVRGIYKSAKQIFETVFSQQSSSFRRVGLVEFPGPGKWSIVFLSAPPAPGVAATLPAKEEYISVFLPCTPNPTTGFWFYLPAGDVIEVPLTADEALKLIVSAGVIQPAEQTRLTEIADAARRDRALAAVK
jgi:uncharacterized membrane protein